MLTRFLLSFCSQSPFPPVVIATPGRHTIALYYASLLYPSFLRFNPNQFFAADVAIWCLLPAHFGRAIERLRRPGELFFVARTVARDLVRLHPMRSDQP